VICSSRWCSRFLRHPAFSLGSAWGWRIDPVTHAKSQFHSGQDYRAEAGTPIPAEIAGEVVYSGFNDKPGNTVIVKHRNGDYGLYAHMQDGDRAEVGRPVWPGEILGRVGNTGAGTAGNHRTTP
jgi:murein DD-endopeptidase MepM/ murein hydrolase activator NlpD